MGLEIGTELDLNILRARFIRAVDYWLSDPPKGSPEQLLTQIRAAHNEYSAFVERLGSPVAGGGK